MAMHLAHFFVEVCIMKEMLQQAKKLLGFVAAVLLIYVVIHYWPAIESVLKVALGAAVPLIIGCGIAYVINILMNFYENLYDRLFKVVVARKIKRIVCLIFAFLTLFTIVMLVVSLVLPELINCIASFVQLIPGALLTVVDFVGKERVANFFPELINDFDFTNISTEVEQLVQTVVGGVGGAVGSILAAVSSAFGIVVDVVIGLIFSLYILLEKEKLATQSKQIIHTYFSKAADGIFYVIRVLDESFHSFIVGQCVEAVILGSLCVVGMWILQLPYAVMIGVFIGFTALIPIAGAYLGAAVGVVMILTVSPFQAIQFLVFILILQQIEGNLIYPRVVGQSMGLPGIWVLSAITIGGGVLGIGGMLLAVPLFAAAYRLIREDIARRNPQMVEETVEENMVVEETKEELEESDKES